MPRLRPMGQREAWRGAAYPCAAQRDQPANVNEWWIFAVGLTATRQTDSYFTQPTPGVGRTDDWRMDRWHITHIQSQLGEHSTYWAGRGTENRVPRGEMLHFALNPWKAAWCPAC